MLSNHFDCAVVGDWHLAFVTAGVLSSNGNRVLLVNHKPENTWSNFPELPVHEPGLGEMIAQARKSGLLEFANGVSDSWVADRVWMAIDTPIDEKDEADLTSLIHVSKLVSQSQSKIKAFIVSSQVPMGFCSKVEREYNLPVVYIPENLRLGKGIETLKFADRTVLGASSESVRFGVKEFLSFFTTEFVFCDLHTAEMVKHANNAFLATSISFANELARLAEVFEVDSQTVAKAMKLDKRIGSGAYVAPGLGFAGGTLPRDIRILQKLGAENHIPMRIMDSVMAVNEDTTNSICETVERLCANRPKQILILGYTYKADTDTLRRSLSLDVAKILVQKGYEITGVDSVMNNKDLTLLKGLIHHVNSLTEVKKAPSLILIMTGRAEFKELSWEKLSCQWKENNLVPVVYDTQNCVQEKNVLAAGFPFKKIWSPMRTPQEKK